MTQDAARLATISVCSFVLSFVDCHRPHFVKSERLKAKYCT